MLLTLTVQPSAVTNMNPSLAVLSLLAVNSAVRIL